jgi:hypothetical protein
MLFELFVVRLSIYYYYDYSNKIANPINYQKNLSPKFSNLFLPFIVLVVTFFCGDNNTVVDVIFLTITILVTIIEIR